MLALLTPRNDIRFATEGVRTVKHAAGMQLDLVALDSFRGLILDASDVRYALDMLNQIRSSPAPHHYLKPVFLYSESGVADLYLLALADGIVDSQNTQVVENRADKILEETLKFREIQEDSLEKATILKALRYLVSRKADLEPVILPKSRFGYIYPLIATNFIQRDDARIYHVVETIEEQKAMDPTFVDRIRLCNRCSSAFLNLREVCTKCGGANLRVDDLIHHFPCGHVEAETRFQVKDKLVCPKCRKILRHIGMDYDKPSIIYTCSGCQQTFQDPDVVGFCFYCTNVSPVDSLLTRDIKSYRMNPTGVNFAVNGLRFSLSEFLRDGIRLVEYDHFQTMLEFEYEREKRYKRPGVVIYFQITNFDKVYALFGQKRAQIALEMARVIKDTLRDSDAIAPLNESSFAFLLVETPMENAHLVSQRLKERFDHVFESNFKDFKVEIDVEPYTLDQVLLKKTESVEAPHE